MLSLNGLVGAMFDFVSGARRSLGPCANTSIQDPDVVSSSSKHKSLSPVLLRKHSDASTSTVSTFEQEEWEEDNNDIFGFYEDAEHSVSSPILRRRKH